MFESVDNGILSHRWKMIWRDNDNDNDRELAGMVCVAHPGARSLIGISERRIRVQISQRIRTKTGSKHRGLFGSAAGAHRFHES